MKNRNKIIIISLVAIVGLAALAYFTVFKKTETTVQIETTTVKKGDISTLVTATGTVEPVNQVDVGTQVSGDVKKIYVDYNSKVKKGQLLAELDKTNLKASLLEAQATYKQAVSEEKYLKNKFERQKQLYEKKMIPISDYEEAEYNLIKAQQNVVQSLSALNKAKTNLSYANIYSPIDGVILSRDVDEGQTVAASLETPTLFTIAQDLKEMQVEADVDEADIGMVKQGQRVQFTVDAFQGEEFTGTVTQIRLNPTVSSNVVTYTVVIKAENPDMKLMPGLTATISIYTVELNDVLTIEAKALNFSPTPDALQAYNEQNGLQNKPPKGAPPSQPKGKNTAVVWVKNGKELVSKTIKTGVSDGVNVEVKDGLSLGDKILYKLSLESGSTTEKPGGSDEEGGSPFMPKPPGKKNKK